MATRLTYLSTIQKEVDDSSTTSQSVIQNHILEVYQEIAAEIAPFVSGQISEEVAITSATVTPANTYQRLESVHYKGSGGTAWNELQRISEKDLSYYLNNTSETPDAYLMRGNTIVLTGSPTTGTLRLQGMGVKAELDDDNEVSIIPDRYSRVLILGCVAKFKAYEDNPSAIEYFNLYQQAKREMLNQLAIKAPIIKPSLY